MDCWAGAGAGDFVSRVVAAEDEGGQLMEIAFEQDCHEKEFF